MGIRHKINKNFFKVWSPNMAYVLGYIYADGCLINCDYIRARYITIASIDRSSLERIKIMLDSEHKITPHKSQYKNGKEVFGYKIGSNEMYGDLLKLGLYPNKSLTVKFPNIPQKYIDHFIRGYFDGDGCIYFEKARSYTGRIIIKRIRTIFTSGSRIFLQKMNRAMIDMGIDNGKIYDSKRAFQLVFNNRNSIQIFKLMYKKAGINSFFMRKFKIFNDYFSLRPINIDKTVRKIIDFHTKGHVVKKLTRRSAKPLHEGANPSMASKANLNCF